MPLDMIRLRFAPSPTGPLHIGGVRTALYNYLFAKQSGGLFVLRIEDTDQNRCVTGAEEYILKALDWCGITFDEGPHVGGSFGPYRQSERKNIYKQYADHLVENGFAYYAFDTAQELEEMRNRLKAAKVATPQYNAVTRGSMKNSLTLSHDEVQKRMNGGEPYVIRIKIPRKEDIRIQDMIRGWVVVQSSMVDDKVLFKSDGMPTYHLANVVDDHLMRITHVIRGEEWLPSTPVHVLLYKYLGWENEQPNFAHLPLLLRPDGNGKLSKRDGDRLGFPVFPLKWTDPVSKEVSSGYQEQGYFPDAFINMLAFLGWNPGTTQELFSMDELVKSFALNRVGKSGAKFDIEKAHWFNQQYLRAKSNVELAELFFPILQREGINAPMDFIAGVCGLMKERATFIKDMLEGLYFFSAPSDYDKETINKKWKEDSPAIIAGLMIVLKEIEEFTSENIETEFKKSLETKGLSIGAVVPNMRLLITGIGSGPSIFEITAVIGKTETLKRMETGLQKLSSGQFSQ